MFKSLKKIFIGSLTSIVNSSKHTKYGSLSNQKWATQPTLINLHPDEYTQGLRFQPFAANLNRCVGSCKTLNDLSNKVCVSNKIRFQSKHFQHDSRNKSIENTSKACIMQMQM